MPKVIWAWLSAALLTASPGGAPSAGRPLCDVGSSVVELLHFEFTPRREQHGPFNPVDLRSSIIFLAECPSSVVPAFGHYSEEPELRRAWIDAVRLAARDSSNLDMGLLLVAAEASVARLGDRSLDEYLDGIFDEMPRDGGGEHPSFEPVLERQASATLKRYAQCDGAGCFNASDNVLFLLGTHPIAVFKAMHADSANATQWLRRVRDESFAGDPDRGESREAARREVLRKLSATKAPGFQRELRACEDTLGKIRYRAVD